MSIANQGFPAFRADLNDALPALASNNSGATEPSAMFAHQWWVDTSANPSVLKQRNADNDAWITFGTINQTGDTFSLVAESATLSGGTANGVTYLNGSKVLTSGSALTFDGANLGVGTSSPSAKLQIDSGSTTYSANIKSRNSNFGSGVIGAASGILTVATDMNNIAFYTASNLGVDGASAPTNERMRIDSTGNVGIGTSSPDEILHIYKTTDPAFRIQSSAGNCYVVNRSGTSAMEFLNVMNGPMTFFTNSAERARITADGVFLINSTAGNGNTLQKMGLVFNGSVEWGISIQTTSNTGSALNFNNAAGTQIGTIAVSGTSTGYNTSSDYRLKEDWQPMTGASERVQALKPVNFAWKADGSRVDGFLAHEAQEVVPECVTGVKDAVDAEGKPNYQGIDQSKLVPLLTAALQEALTKIDSLTARLDAANL